uniref:Uncharacterized protein n=1 Tax=Avena sativa TaxID=4498 RepID=A0ACD5ZPW7_AVESA
MLCDETEEPKALPLLLLEEITGGFSDQQKIGSGGFAVVYKGKLKKKTVAVKRMSNTYMYEKEFHREVECLMMARHKNVVRFLGYCADTQGTMARYDGKFVMADVQQRLLCFEYLPKGSLDGYITDTTSGLQWRDRYQIIKGVCQGLHYLHQKNIVHLDLKPANILLDDNLVAKISDFGLSRCFDVMQSRVITVKIGGTLGYLAPEFSNGEITYQFDIYSLGVVIIEILTGKKGYHDVDSVVESWSNMLEKSQRNVQLEQVRVCAEIGIECTDFNPAKRPDTRFILDRIDETETMDGYTETGVITSQQVELASNELHQNSPNEPGEASSEHIFCMPNVKLPYVGRLISLQTLPAFTVRNEQGCELKQLRGLNKLRGCLDIRGVQNVRDKEEALEANLTAKKRLTELDLRWDEDGDTRCTPEVQADVLEGLCPPMELQTLRIYHYQGSRYPEWMVGRQNGGPKELQQLWFWRCKQLGPAPQFVEAYPHLRVLKLWVCNWDALPGNIELLTSLKALEITGCRNIQSLPKLPQSIEKFCLSICDDEFMISCQTVGHPNWQKIEHIPNKYICGPSYPVATAEPVATSDLVATAHKQNKILSYINRLRCF